MWLVWECEGGEWEGIGCGGCEGVWCEGEGKGEDVV